MDYWTGMMNWPLRSDWKCQTCGASAGTQGLTWGLIHAECRCNQCHTNYYMRDENGNVTNVPICMLKEEYKAPARAGWNKWHTPISEWDDAAWDEAIKESEKTIFARVRSSHSGLFSTEEIALEEIRAEKEQSHANDANDHRGEE